MERDWYGWERANGGGVAGRELPFVRDIVWGDVAVWAHPAQVRAPVSAATLPAFPERPFILQASKAALSHAVEAFGTRLTR